MLHQKGPVALLDALRDEVAADIAAVDEIIFIASVSPGDHGLSDKAADAHRPLLRLDLRQIGSHVPPVDVVNHVLQVVVSGGVKLRLPVRDELEGDIRAGQGQPLHQLAHIARFCHGRFQKFPAGRGIVKEAAHQEGGAVRRRRLLQLLFRAPLYHIADAFFGVRRLRNQLHHGNRGDA